MLSILLVKLIATAVVVIGVSLAVGKLGPRLGGIIAGTPIILGPGYFFMLQEHSPAFIYTAALSTLHALVATLLFSISFVVTAGRLSALASLGIATLCWVPAALLFSRVPGGVGVAVMMYLAMLVLAEGVRRALKLSKPIVVARTGWFDLVLRGLLAGVLVSVATTLAVKSGPLLSGMLVGFPVGLFTIGWTLHERYGPDVARATVSMAQKGMLSLVAFGVVTATLVGHLPPMVVFLLSLGASMSVSASLFLVSQWRFRRALARKSDTLSPNQQPSQGVMSMTNQASNPAESGNLVDSRSGGEDERRILRRDPDPYLFRPVQFRSVRARNRIMLSPMCQYSGQDGLSNDWHFVHLGARAIGGAGLVFTEAVHIESRGRITPYCLGLWNDEQRDRLARIATFVEAQGAVPGIQLGHAGRKASVGRPWEGSHPLRPSEGGWDDLVAASALPYAKGWHVPAAMTSSQIEESLNSLKASTRRAREAGFKVLELHGAHGYLIHQFLSPLSNRRDDAYGGSFENRIRFLLESISVVREEWPDDLPLFVRLSCTDWVEGGWTLHDTVRLSDLLHAQGQVDLIDCSSGGNDPRQEIPIHPGYQIPLAQTVRRETGIATGAVGLIHSPDLAESVIANGQADLVILGRALLADPAWPLRAAATLKAKNVEWPKQYERSNIF